MEELNLKKLTAAQMKDYIKKNAPEDKEWFLSVIYDENGKYQHLKAKNAFIDKYFPDSRPLPKDKASDIFKDW